MIDIIMSKFPEENSLYIYKDIQKKLQKKEKSFLIVPEQYTLESDIDFIDRIGYEAVIDCKILSFNSLVTFLWQKLNLKKNESLSSISKTIIISSILYKLNDKLRLFSNKVDDIDFVKDLSEIISNIKEYYFDDDFFKTIAENKNIDPMTRLKFGEIKLIFDAYIKEIGENFYDSEDELSLIKDNITNCDFLKDSNFYFDKFDSLSDLRIDFIRELLKIGAKVTVSIAIDKSYYENRMAEDLDIFKQGLNFVEKLKSLDTKINIIGQEKKEILNDLRHLYDNFERYNPKTYEWNLENINVLESVSSTNEIENAALLIEKFIREGYTYSSIAIIMTKADEYENLIKRIFQRFKIPIFLDQAKKLSQNHILRTYLSMLRLVVFDFRQDDLNNFIRSSILDFGENSLERIINFQNYMKERKIKSSMIFDDKYFELDDEFYKNHKNLKEEKEKELKDVLSIRNELIKLISPLYKFKKGNFSIDDLIKEIFNLVDNKILKDGLIHYQASIREKNLAIYEENEQVWDKFMAILDEMVGILKDIPISLRMVYKLIEKACENTNIAIIPPAIDEVLVGDFDRDRINDRDIKIFIGMNDLYFPNSNNADKLISEKEKSQLKKENIDLKIYDNKKEDKKLLNLLRMISSSKKILFSYSLINKSNEAMNMSLSLRDIISIFPKLKINKLVNRDFSILKYSKDLLDQNICENLWKIKKNEPVKEDEKIIIKTYLNFKKNENSLREFNDAKISAYDLFIKGFNYSSSKDSLSKSLATALYNKNKFSVSEIEAYARCPYKYFINYGIKAKEIKSLDVDYMELGNIVHYNMEKISIKLMEMGLEIDNLSLEKIVEENFEKAVKSSLDKLRANYDKNKFILSNIYESNQKASKKILDQIRHGKFIIDSVETKYGKGEDYPEVYVDDENYLEGRIDRIDRYEDYIRIIDYKTGSKEIKIENILNGFELQLFVYMLAVKAKKSDNSKNLKPIASFYLPLKDEILKLNSSYDRESIEKIYNDKLKMNGLIIKVDEEVLKLLDVDFDGKKSNIFKIQRYGKNILSPAEDKKLESFVKDMISTYIGEIKNGNISMNPLRFDDNTYECKNCSYKSICKFDESIDQDKFRDVDKNLSLNDIKKEPADE